MLNLIFILRISSFYQLVFLFFNILTLISLSCHTFILLIWSLSIFFLNKLLLVTLSRSSKSRQWFLGTISIIHHILTRHSFSLISWFIILLLTVQLLCWLLRSLFLDEILRRGYWLLLSCIYFILPSINECITNSYYKKIVR